MELQRHMLRSLFISILALLFVILIVLFPREMTIKVQGYGYVASEYHFSVSAYMSNLRTFFKDAIVNKSLGESFYPGVSAEYTVMKAMSKSLLVMVTALVIGLIIGTLKGIIDYRLANTRFRVFGNWLTWLFQSIPDFLFLLLIQWVMIRHIRSIPFFARGEWYDFILPALLVSMYPIIYIARITHASMTEQGGQLYIQVARSKGVSELLILFRHQLSNSISTILTHVSSMFVYIISNLLMVEIFSNYQGAAYTLFRAIDYSKSFGTGINYNPGIIIGISFCFMLLILFIQFISQLAKRVVDPR